MATILQLRRGTTTQHSSFTGASGEVTVDTTKKTVVVHDGSTAGGSPLATEAYVTSQIQSKDNTDEITEGSTNLYFTTARARNAISAGSGISISNGAISVDTSTIATKTYAETAAADAVAAVIDSAPAALDTLNELAAAINDDASYASTVSTALGNRLRVDVNTQNLTSTQQNYALTNLGLTASLTELNYVDGVTSAIQTQLDAKFASADFNSTFDTRLGTKSTTNLSEGTNLYFTNNRARGAVSVTDSGGDGSLSYDSSTGVITYTGPSASEVRAHFSAGSGISITNGSIASTITQYTDALARSSLSFAAGSGAYNSTTGVITIPTNTSQLTNGANFITLTSLSAGTGISYNNTTGVISADTTTVATKTYVDGKISDLVNGASAAYDTLKEIQDAMATDAELSAAIAAITIGNATQTITAGSYLTGGGTFTANQTTDSSVTLAVDAASANTASKIVARDSSGNFAAGTITADLTGNASTATKWATARTITLGGDLTGSVSIDGSANVTLTATVAADSVALGTDTTGNYVASVATGTGLTGGAAGSEGTAISLGIDTGVVATLTGTQTLTNKTLTSPTLTTPAVGSGGFTVAGSTSGTTTVVASATASGTITLPAVTGTVVTTGDTGTVTNTMLAGSIANAKLANSSISLAGTSVSLGGSFTAQNMLDAIKTVDGSGSGLDADLLDGQSSAYFRINIYDASGTLLN